MFSWPNDTIETGSDCAIFSHVRFVLSRHPPNIDSLYQIRRLRNGHDRKPNSNPKPTRNPSPFPIPNRMPLTYDFSLTLAYSSFLSEINVI